MHPGLSTWAHINHGVLESGEPFQNSKTQRDGSRRRTVPAIAGFDNGAKECTQALEAGKCKETSRKECNLLKP